MRCELPASLLGACRHRCEFKLFSILVSPRSFVVPDVTSRSCFVAVSSVTVVAFFVLIPVFVVASFIVVSVLVVAPFVVVSVFVVAVRG